MSKNHTIKGRVFDFDCCQYVEFWGYCMLGMCDVPDVGCWGYGMLGMWDVGDVGCSGCGMLGMWDVGDVGCWGCGMLGMWDVGDVGCSGCGMLGMLDVRDVGCSGCGMCRMWDARDVGCAGCGMRGMWDIPDVGCGMWDVDLQNANSCEILVYKIQTSKVTKTVSSLTFLVHVFKNSILSLMLLLTCLVKGFKIRPKKSLNLLVGYFGPPTS